MKFGGKVKLSGELTVIPARKELECEKCAHPLTFDDNGILVCRKCNPNY